MFLDIHLSDGLSFDIFKQVEYEKPVIFTTAYDEYSLKAFKVNSIDYLLKPVSKNELDMAITKLKRWNGRNNMIDYQALDRYFQEREFRKRFMVRTGNRYIYIDQSDISLFYAEGKIAYLMKMLNGQKFIIESTLEELEKQLDPVNFFRVSRKVIISVSDIAEIRNYPGNRLQVFTKTRAPFDVVVSREKVSKFKHWLDQ
jgi:DNA-binding LytR/AlgR family response regulator